MMPVSGRSRQSFPSGADPRRLAAIAPPIAAVVTQSPEDIAKNVEVLKARLKPPTAGKKKGASPGSSECVRSSRRLPWLTC